MCVKKNYKCETHHNFYGSKIQMLTLWLKKYKLYLSRKSYLEKKRIVNFRLEKSILKVDKIVGAYIRPENIKRKISDSYRLKNSTFL